MSEKSTSRHRIMEAAEVIFADKGYHATAVDEIASRTNISKGGVYFHFPCKERLFFAVLDHLADRLAHRIQTDVAQKSNALARLEISLATVLESLSKRKSLAKLMLIQGYSMGNALTVRAMVALMLLHGLLALFVGSPSWSTPGTAPGL